MSKEDITKGWIEHMVGREIIDYEIKPMYDTDGNIISYDIMVQPKQSLEHIEKLPNNLFGSFYPSLVSIFIIYDCMNDFL